MEGIQRKLPSRKTFLFVVPSLVGLDGLFQLLGDEDRPEGALVEEHVGHAVQDPHEDEDLA